ncbi:DUF3224 domain-containing protein [Streptomyces sp. NPDC047525]|uniref:DUF3224 domain-containing protein n=1 Tax=Streptomyces sp. NPDC047525 TaxID=3155264 RepID=UPI0033F72626
MADGSPPDDGGTAGAGPKLTRVTIRKRYSGVIEGTLDGRQGTFVIQHGGSADGEDQSSDGSIVPHSGTDGRTGI